MATQPVTSTPLEGPRLCCPVCAGTERTFVTRTPPLPVFQGVLPASTAPGDDKVAELPWMSCGACGTVYLSGLLPLDVVYMASHAGSFGAVWDRHHEELARFVAKHAAPGPILEVGGGVGKLAAAYVAQTGAAAQPWTILEANPKPESAIPGVTFIKGLFDASTSALEGRSTVVWSHCLEHVYDVGGAVAAVAAKLPVGGVHIVSWPHMDDWLAAGVPGAVNSEHTFYIPPATLLEVHAAQGLQLVDRADYKDSRGFNHSFFMAFRKTGDAQVPRAPKWDPACVAPAAELVGRFWARAASRAAALKKVLETSPAPHFVMPASAYAQMLFSFGLQSPQLQCLLDNATSKQGQRLYGTQLLVRAPGDAVAGLGAGTVVVHGGAHTGDMIAGLRALNPALTLVDAGEH